MTRQVPQGRRDEVVRSVKSVLHFVDMDSCLRVITSIDGGGLGGPGR
jgi:hypothetical protein